MNQYWKLCLFNNWIIVVSQCFCHLCFATFLLSFLSVLRLLFEFNSPVAFVNEVEKRIESFFLFLALFVVPFLFSLIPYFVKNQIFRSYLGTVYFINKGSIILLADCNWKEGKRVKIKGKKGKCIKNESHSLSLSLELSLDRKLWI